MTKHFQHGSIDISGDDLTNNTGNVKSAINFLLMSGSEKMSEPPVTLTQCSPSIDIIMNKQGGICVKCNTNFKSKVSLMEHNCNGNEDGNYDTDNSINDSTNTNSISKPKLKLMVLSQ